MSHSYRKVFAIPGAIGFSTAAFLGRLPAGMVGLAIIMPLSMLTGSYAIAGAVAACAMIGMAMCAPLSGRLVDRYGQSRILYTFAALNFICTSALIACIQFDAPFAILCSVGAITGASRLSTGTLARVRWAYVMQALEAEQRKTMLQAAYAFEGVVDEIVFISAPILATLLCTAVHPLAGLVCCLLSFVVGAVALGMQTSTQPVVASNFEKQPFAFTISGLQVIFAAVLFIGVSAGAVEVVVVARAVDSGSRQLAGILLATLAFSSVLAGFWYGARTFKLNAHILWIRCLGLLVLTLVPFVLATDLVMLGCAMFVAGLAIAPTSIAGQVLTERILPAKQLNEGMNIVVTAMIFGMAAGAGISGVLIDNLGTYYAGLLPALATLVAFVIAILGSRSLQPSVITTSQ